jgi:iron(III) transport system permease protein
VLRWVLLAVILGYGVLVFIWPLILIVLLSFLPFYSVVNGNPFQHFTLVNYHNAFVDSQLRSSIVTSTILAACVAVAAVGMALLLAWIALKSRSRARHAADVLAMAPIAIPPMVLSLGLLLTVLSVPGLGPVLYGSNTLMFLADLIVFMPLSMRLVSSTLIQLQDELIEAARAAGASPWRTIRTVVIPIVRPALYYTAAVVFVLSYRELAAIVLIPAENVPLVPYAALVSWLAGGIPELAALNVVTMLIPLVVIGVTFGLARLGRIGSRGPAPRKTGNTDRPLPALAVSSFVHTPPPGNQNA